MSLQAQLEAALRNGASAGLVQAAHRIFERADADIPRGDPGLDPDPGQAIKDSKHIEVEGTAVTLSYDTPYAAYQHENRHAKHPRGGKAQFLSDAVKAEVPQLEGIVAAEVRKLVGGR